MQLTTKQFAEKAKVDYQVGLAVLNFLVSRGIATKLEETVQTNGRGKPASQFIVPEGKIEIEFLKQEVV